jgi:hypothetical protein
MLRACADLPKLRAWRARPQLGIAGVFAVRRSKSALPILFFEKSARSEARAVSLSRMCVRQVCAADPFAHAETGQQSDRADALPKAAMNRGRMPVPEATRGQSKAG